MKHVNPLPGMGVANVLSNSVLPSIFCTRWTLMFSWSDLLCLLSVVSCLVKSPRLRIFLIYILFQCFAGVFTFHSVLYLELIRFQRWNKGIQLSQSQCVSLILYPWDEVTVFHYIYSFSIYFGVFLDFSLMTLLNLPVLLQCQMYLIIHLYNSL